MENHRVTERVAILGMGRWGRAWKRVLEDLPGVEVVGGEHLHAGGRRRDYLEILDEPGVTSVIVTLPVALHLSAITAAVERGLPVLCEKPLVSNWDELAQLLSIDGNTDVVIRVDQNYRMRPWVAEVRSAVAGLGSIRHVAIRFAQEEFLDGGRGELSHPLLEDMVIHHVDLLRFITGQGVTVLGAWSSRPSQTTYSGDTDLDAVLELSGGAIVNYAGTWAARGGTTPWDGDWEIRCDGGVVTVRGLDVFVQRPGGQLEPRPYAIERREDADLAATWEEFVAARAGDEDRGVSVPDNARSLEVVLELMERVAVAPVERG